MSRASNLSSNFLILSLNSSKKLCLPQLVLLLGLKLLCGTITVSSDFGISLEFHIQKWKCQSECIKQQINVQSSHPVCERLRANLILKTFEIQCSSSHTNDLTTINKLVRRFTLIFSICLFLNKVINPNEVQLYGVMTTAGNMALVRAVITDI